MKLAETSNVALKDKENPMIEGMLGFFCHLFCYARSIHTGFTEAQFWIVVYEIQPIEMRAALGITSRFSMMALIYWLVEPRWFLLTNTCTMQKFQITWLIRNSFNDIVLG